MNDASIPHRIERTHNRHSRAVYRDGAVVIRLARNLSAFEERRHVDFLLKRMVKVVHQERSRTAIDPFRPLLQGESILTLELSAGHSWIFELVPGTRTRAKRTPDGYRVTVGPRLGRHTLHRYLWSLLAELEYARVLDMVESIDRQTLNSGFRGLRLRYMTSQWGSCSARGDVVLNTALLLLPEPLLRYVIVHELVHRLHRNHSKRYWDAVERVLPTFENDRKNVKKYRLRAL